MAAQFALSRANVETPGGERFGRAAVMVRRNVLTVRQRGVTDPVVFDTTVQEAKRLSKAQWEVKTDAGVFTITRDKDCGCGG